jgi:hypothetical protein
LNAFYLRLIMYAAILAALLGGFAYYTHHERVIGEQKIEAADTAATLKTTLAANARIAALDAAYQSQLQETQKTYEQMHTAGVARADDLASKLSTYARHRCGSALPQSPGAASKPDGAAPVAGSDDQLATSARRLLEAVAADAAELTALQAERASLNK